MHKIADAILEMEGVGHRVTVCLVPSDKGIRGVVEAKRAAVSTIDNGSELTAAPAERVRELSGVLRLVKAERAKGLHTNEDDVCVRYYRWKMDKAWSGKHTLNLYGALSSDEASILVQARTEHRGLNACLFRKKLGDSPTCECGRGDETVLHVLLSLAQPAAIPRLLPARSALTLIVVFFLPPDFALPLVTICHSAPPPPSDPALAAKPAAPAGVELRAPTPSPHPPRPPPTSITSF